MILIVFSLKIRKSGLNFNMRIADDSVICLKKIPFYGILPS